jgi:quinol monooxygenase YgiN
MKIARNVQFKLKPGKADEFNRIFTSDVLPLLKKQHGFNEELTLVSADRGLGISVWNDRPSADAYTTHVYPQVLAKLNPMLDGTPIVDTYDVTVSANSAVTA